MTSTLKEKLAAATHAVSQGVTAAGNHRYTKRAGLLASHATAAALVLGVAATGGFGKEAQASVAGLFESKAQACTTAPAPLPVARVQHKQDVSTYTVKKPFPKPQARPKQ